MEVLLFLWLPLIGGITSIVSFFASIVLFLIRKKNITMENNSSGFFSLLIGIILATIISSDIIMPGLWFLSLFTWILIAGYIIFSFRSFIKETGVSLILNGFGSVFMWAFSYLYLFSFADGWHGSSVVPTLILIVSTISFVALISLRIGRVIK